jgi:cytochrome b subunit of formate dehydrogenase
VVFPDHHFSKMENQILNTDDVKRYANGTDKVLAWILMISTYTMILCGIVGWIFGIGDNP